MAHTPGPWTIRHGTNVFGKDIHYRNSERVVANAGGHDNNRFFEEVSEENKANAILIAAAPELLAACEGILPFVREDFSDETPDGESCASDEYREAFRAIVNAVKKAKGGTL